MNTLGNRSARWRESPPLATAGRTQEQDHESFNYASNAAMLRGSPFQKGYPPESTWSHFYSTIDEVCIFHHNINWKKVNCSIHPLTSPLILFGPTDGSATRPHYLFVASQRVCSFDSDTWSWRTQLFDASRLIWCHHVATLECFPDSVKPNWSPQGHGLNPSECWH